MAISVVKKSVALIATEHAQAHHWTSNMTHVFA